MNEQIIIPKEKVILIDPLILSENSSRILRLMLEQHKDMTVFQRGNGMSDLRYKIYLPHPGRHGKRSKRYVVLARDLVRREGGVMPGTGGACPRYSVLSCGGSECLGSGHFSGVYRIAGTLTGDDHGGMRLKTHKRRVIKIQRHDKHWPWQAALREWELIAPLPHLSAKNISFDICPDGIVKSYLVMKECAGHELFSVIKEDMNNNYRCIQLAARMRISRNLLRALKEQVHDYGLVHRDIKPENIFFNPDTFEVNIIDYGLSCHAAYNDHKYPGSAIWAAPEVYTRAHALTHWTDIYSMALILSVLWGGQPRNPDSHFEQIRLQVGMETATLPRFCIRGLDINHYVSIVQLLENMMRDEPASRSSLQQGIELFDQMELELRLAGRPREERRQMAAAHAAANEARRRLHALDRRKKNNPLSRMEHIICAAVETIADSPCALAEFIDTLEIDVLKAAPARSKAALQLQVRDIINAFAWQAERLLDLNENVLGDYIKLDELAMTEAKYLAAKRELEGWLNDAKHVLDKLIKPKRRLILDDIAALNERIGRVLPDLETRRMQYLRSGGLFARKQSCQPALRNTGRHRYSAGA